MTADDALRGLAASTAAAVVGVLREFLPDGVELGEAEIIPAGMWPLEGVGVPAVAAEVSYVDGASGGAVLVTTIRGARQLAAAATALDADDGTEPLGVDERSAVAHAMDQVMTAVASATSRVLDTDVDISPPEIRDLETVADTLALVEGSRYATSVAITLAGEPCRLVQLVPKAFVVRMTRALDDLAATDFADGRTGGGDGDDRPDEILRGVPLRVCAEIGRASMPMADAVSLPDGGLVELDRAADDPVDVMVNGRRFAIGRLVLVDDEWAVRIEEVLMDASELPQATATSIERS